MNTPETIRLIAEVHVSKEEVERDNWATWKAAKLDNLKRSIDDLVDEEIVKRGWARS